MSAPHPYEHEDEWLLLISQGDGQAFEHFYRCHCAGVFNAIMLYLKDEEAAREIVQIVFIKIWDQRHLLRNVRSLSNYLFILTRNAAFDHFRKVTIETRGLAGLRARVPGACDDVSLGIQEREYQEWFRQVIAKLPQQQRMAYLMASEQEMSYEEIAARMQISRLTVKRHLELARNFVRKQLQEHLHQGILVFVFFYPVWQAAGFLFNTIFSR